MFQRNEIDRLFAELGGAFRDDPDYERLLRDAHLGIALKDAGQALAPEIDERVAALLDKHGSNSS